jgi:hypothetical protein
MKKLFLAAPIVILQFLIKVTRLKSHILVAIICLTGCTATVVRWNSVRMREEIMAYYNDEIMDNLIRMKDGLPFVHVDISSVSAAGLSQVSGTVGGGDTESFTKTSPSSTMMGTLRTITRAAMTPFVYSVAPLHSDTLTMSAVPVLGPLPEDSQTTPKTTTKTEITKPIKSDPEKNEKSVTTITTDQGPKASTTTIYQIYRDFLCNCPNALGYKNLRPNSDEFVPGTLKIRGTGFYYIRKSCQAQYTTFCERLFTQSRGKTAAKSSLTDLEVIKAQGGLIPSTPRSP